MNAAEQSLWDAYHHLLFAADRDRLRKILAREELFRRTVDVPGDIVECGVFKGAGLLLWLKLIDIFCPGSLKRAVGFDVFGDFAQVAGAGQQAAIAAFTAEAGSAGTTLAAMKERVAGAGFGEDRWTLVAGDIRETARLYVDENPGFRISLLHLDLDVEESTGAALEALWPRVVVGGIVIFDEYAVPRWSESAAADRLVSRLGLKLHSLPWAKSPTAYLVKERLS